jgi:hypothetical protein
VEVPALVHRQVKDGAHQQANQTLVTDEDDVFGIVLLPFFFQKFDDALSSFGARLAVREAKIRCA